MTEIRRRVNWGLYLAFKEVPLICVKNLEKASLFLLSLDPCGIGRTDVPVKFVVPTNLTL